MSNWPWFFQQFHRNLRQNLTAMTSLSARSMTPARPDRHPRDKDDENLKYAPGSLGLMKDASRHLCTVKPLDLTVSNPDTVKTVPAFLHVPQNYRREQSEGREKTAAILLSGAGGGVVGPSSIYLSIADKLASPNRGIPVMRLDFRYPARNKYCVLDVLAAMDYLQNGHAVSRFVLVGWSFGGAPVFTVGGQDERVVDCATIASQTAETEGVREVAKRGVSTLLLHGTADRTLGASCSESLYEKYQTASRGGHCDTKLFDGDDHALTNNSMKAEKLLCEFIMKQAGVEIGEMERQNVVQKPLIGENEKVTRMEEGDDLQGETIG